MTQSRYPSTIHVDQATIDKIDTPVDSAVISSRPGGGGNTQSYLKGDIIADQLNAVFGPLGWSKASRIHSVDDWEEEKTVQRNNSPTKVTMHMVQVISDVTLTIKKMTPDGSDTVFVEQGVGYGEVEAGKSRKDAFGMAVKGASTDGLKRSSSLIGKAFGMMMASNGQQEDIQYAHNGKAADLTKARNMRRQAAGGNDGGRDDDRGGRQQPRQRDDDRDQRQGGDQQRDGGRSPRDGGGGQNRDGGREQPRDGNRDEQRQERAPERERQDQREPDAGGSRGRRQEEETRRIADEARGPDAPAREQGGGGQDRPDDAAGRPAARSGERQRRVADTNYSLDNVPVSKDDQTDFAATLNARVGSMRQKADREGLVRQHLNTIRNLDGPIRKHLVAKLAEQGLDVDRL